MDYTLLIVTYFTLLLLIGIFMGRAGNERSFILADQQITFPLLVATIVSTFYGASAVIGAVSITNQIGLGVIWFIVPFYLGNIFLIWLIPRIKCSESFTLPDFLGGFYGKGVASVASLLLAVLCLVPESIIAGGRILEMMTPLTFLQSMIVVCIIIVLYTLIGGMRSVVVSDLLQFALMLVSLLIIVPYLIPAGLEEGASPIVTTIESLPDGFLDPFAFMGTQEIIVWFILLFSFPVVSAPLYQRIFASAPWINVRKALIYSLIIWFFIDLIVVFSGLTSVQYEPYDPDKAFFILGATVLPPILQAVFLLGILSAVMSTADSFLHSGASSLSYDVFRPIIKKEGRIIVLFSRLMVILLGAASLYLALYFQEIIPALIFLLTVWISGMLIPTLYTLFYLRLTQSAAFLSIVSGSLAAVLWRFYPLMDAASIDPLFVGLTCSLIFAFTTNLITK